MVLTLFLTITLTTQAQFQAKFSRTPSTILVSLDAYKVRISTSRITAPVGMKETWWGELDVKTWTYISHIEASWRGKPVFVPVSSYSALANPLTAKLQRSRKGAYTLEIFGGDTGSAYRAYLNIDRDRVNSRQVKSDEFPDSAWERTEYKYNDTTN